MGVEIHEEAIPYSDSLIHFCDENHLDPLGFALNGGEDYELLFTVPLAKISEVLLKSCPRRNRGPGEIHRTDGSLNPRGSR